VASIAEEPGSAGPIMCWWGR